MKNKILNIIIILGLMLFPVFIEAITYEEAIYTSNNFIKKLPKYDSYIITNTKDDIYYPNANGEFVYGGILNSEEYLRAKNDESSYLYTGTKYLTYKPIDGSKLSEKISVAPDVNKLVDLSKQSNIGIRVTEYIKSDVQVSGVGTYSEPWVFSQINSVVFRTNEYGKIYEPKNGKCNGEGSMSNELELRTINGNSVKVCLAPNDGYEYVNNTCGIYYDNAVTVQLRRDIECQINFGYKTYKIDLSQEGVDEKSVPETIYLVYGKGWYSDVSGITSISKLSEIPKKEGYIFNGYIHNGITIIDEEGNLNRSDSAVKSFKSSPTKPIAASWKPKTYNIKFDNKNGDDIFTEVVTYDSALPTLDSKPTMSGLRFNGYVDDKNNIYYDKDLNKKIDKWTLDKDITLTAKWTDGSIKYEDIASSYNCKNIQVGDEPYLVNYTGRCELLDDGSGNWRLKLLSSGTLVLADKLNVDLFLVGGGGGGGNGSGAYRTHTGGGGGGYTKTHKDLTLNPQSYTVQVGNGGAVGADGQESYFMIGSSKKSADGGKTPSLSIPGLLHCGRGTGMKDGHSIGGNGGSGGGSGASGAEGTPYDTNQCQDNKGFKHSKGGYGGSNGSRGEPVGNLPERDWNCKPFYSGIPVVSSGQGSNTKEFGEESGTLYSGGGGGKHGVCVFEPEESPAGVGGAGGGGTENYRQPVDKSNGEENTGGGGAYKGKGGSGIVILRNKR